MKDMEKKSGRNPKWTESELILALDLYMDLARSEISAKHEKIIELSTALNRLKDADQVDIDKFRNPNGTALKLHNFARFDPRVGYRGMSNGGKLEETIWNRYSSDRKGLREAASSVRASLGTRI